MRSQALAVVLSQTSNSGNIALPDLADGTLRRLRLQKGLSRADFGRISAKEMARIERGQIKRPHPATLETIAAKLGVAVDVLGSF